MTRSLRNKSEFARVYAEGVKRVGRLLVLYTLAAEDDAQAVVASRKVGNAVLRNRAKRLLREALRKMIFGGSRRARGTDPGGGVAREPDRGAEGPTGIWVVAVARREITAAGYEDVRADVERLLADRPSTI